MAASLACNLRALALPLPTRFAGEIDLGGFIMELTLGKIETKEALLEWAEENWPGTFKDVELGDRYASIGATFTTVEPGVERD